MTKGQLLKFLEPFTDETDIFVSIDDGIDPQEVDFEPVYKLRDGVGFVYLEIDDEDL